MRKQLALFVALALLMLAAVPASAEYILLKGDLHCHSSFSHDSVVPYAQVIEDSIVAGYDFIALTEHNTMRHLKEDLSTEGLIVIAGYEYTLRGGHYNLFGARDFTLTTNVNRAELTEAIAYLHELGVLVQLDHPNDKNYPTRYGYAMNFDMLELINGRVTADDLQTIMDYQTLLAEGRRVVATGGTDAHRDHQNRVVYNHVYATERSEKAIVEALRAGRLFVTTRRDGPVILLTSGEAYMGDTVPDAEGLVVDVRIEGVAAGYTVRVYTEQGLLTEEACAGEVFEAAIPAEGCAFVRVEVWQDAETPLAISNPIYIGPGV